MLAKKYRLSAKSMATAGALTAKSRYFLCKRFASTLPYPRFAVAVPATVLPLASKRVALRRLLYREIRSRLATIHPADYVFVLLGSAKKAEPHGIINELLSLLERH